jgi:predicted protein tyrosine phosphatase
MRVEFRSREEAEDSRPDFSAAVISISDPGSRPVDLKPGWHDVLSIQFHDIDMCKAYGAHLRADILKRYSPAMMEHAETIASFVRRVKAEGVERIMVHCEAGISRSAAVAKWIADTYHLTPLGPAVKLHNRHVYKLLCETKA